ncbi:conserved hypothetical protein [uncultured Mycobacterium sp.]|uniref:Uncharacterized protein n=1 Tax=uncultured Mycobacterium sp. TaxID=171292 RepID=A0A1Y5PGR9_9MYCO|nr:conserved hypothetical protein [uncultured Mycobacterium sp.]
MTEDGSGLQVRQSPRKRSAVIGVADFTMMVRVPGQPAAVYVYTDDDRDEAARYAETVGGTVVPLPLAPPAGYTKGPDGSLIPIALAIEGRSRAEPSPTQDVM